jgi:superfamily II DNA or RNA helicase
VPIPLAEASPLRLTPAGRLLPDSSRTADASPALPRVLEAFHEGEAAGLFELAARPLSGGLPPGLAWWRELGARYLHLRCLTPDGGGELQPVPPLSGAETAELLLCAPPMPGGEYLDAGVLARLWAALDEYVRAQAAEAGGLEALLRRRAPLWRQVGRVCFHLAENRKDPQYPFAFLATYAPRLSDSARLRYQPLSRALQELAGAHNRASLSRLLEPIRSAAEKSPLIRDLLDSNDLYHPLAWTPQEAYRFLREAPLYEQSGVLVRVPDWWARRPRPRVAVRIGSEADGLLGAEALLDFQAGVAVGDAVLTPDESRRLLAGGDGLVYLKGQWVEVDREKLRAALAHWKKVQRRAASGGISFIEGMRLLAGAPLEPGEPEEDSVREWSAVSAGSRLADALALLRASAADQAGARAAKPPGLRAALRPYQQAGLQWLSLLTGLGLGACLADDMGLGKTVQLLALLLEQRRARQTRPSLVVLPASLLANWKAEIERFAPRLRAFFLHPSMSGKLPPAETGPAPEELARTDAVFTTYGLLPRQPWLESARWNLLVLDEAQAIKNPASRQARAVKRLSARARIALTGTPVENNLSDLWSLFDFLCPGLLGSSARFKQFVRRLESREGERYGPLRSLVQPYILRRLKTDRKVISDLPEKTEVRAYCGLSPSQAALYRSAVQELEAGLRRTEGIQRRGLILATLLRLKQICNHPAHLRGEGRWLVRESGKLERLAELASELASRQDRALVFTQFREAAEPLASFLAGVFGRAGLVLHGGTPVKERRRIVEAFQAEDGPPFFVLSLKAGGTGLNLTAASHVVHFDRWWNPAVENQATDRAFRIGQRRNVLVHKFICRGTVEERIDELIQRKTALARDLLQGGGERLLTELSDRELLQTVRLDLGRARAGT